MAEEQEKRPDQTIPGGIYIVDGIVKDANGKPREGWTVDKNGKAVPPKLAPAKEKPEQQ
jgi:hypothetical protein